MTPPGKAPPETERCGAKKRQGIGHCTQVAGWGTDHPGVGKCKLHGGATESGRKAATREGAEQEAQRMVRLAGVDQDPIEHLLESLHLAAALVQVWGTMVAAIDVKAEEEAEADGFLRGELGYEEVESDKGFTDMVVRPKDRLMAVDSRGESQVHPYMAEYQRALERRAKFAKLCIDAGVAERQIQLVERQGQLVAQAIKAILDELGVGDRPEVPSVVRRHLSLVSATS
jgi:hypothetical protein